MTSTTTQLSQAACCEHYEGFYTKIHPNGCGLITLNRSTKLNALNFCMLKNLFSVLMSWRNNKSVYFIVIKSNCSKAFCAGGDMVELAEAIFDPITYGFYAWEFIYVEYRLDLLIATYKKPIISIVNGIVMGGGAGLALNSEYLIITPNIKFAMPEVNVFWFPDVLSSYYLSKLPRNIGKYLMLTGNKLNFYEIVKLGLILNNRKQFCCDIICLNELIDHLINDDFNFTIGDENNYQINHRVRSSIERLLFKFNFNRKNKLGNNIFSPEAEIKQHSSTIVNKVDLIEQCFGSFDWVTIIENLENVCNDNWNNNKKVVSSLGYRDWAKRSKKQLESTSPLSLEVCVLGILYL